MDTPVSNNACVCKLFTCMLYSTWKLSMKTSLITNALGIASHAEELSESSNIIFLNSEIKLLNSLLPVITSRCGYFIKSAFYPETFYEKFLLSYAVFSFVDLYFEGELCLGAVGQFFLKCSPWQCQHLGLSSLVDGCCVFFVVGLLDL